LEIARMVLATEHPLEAPPICGKVHGQFNNGDKKKGRKSCATLSPYREIPHLLGQDIEREEKQDKR
jgi:hypothetical protein